MMMKGWKAVISIILIFLLGGLAGALVVNRLDQHKIESVMHGESGTTREFIVTRLNRELGLDANQLEQLRTIVQETHMEMRNLRKQYRPQIEEILKRSQDKVRAILRPEQLDVFNKIVAERKKRHEGEHEGEEDNK
jgi:uncharacterized protein YsxB (DUF464 family)